MEIINLSGIELTFTQVLKIFMIIIFIVFFAHLLYSEDYPEKEEDEIKKDIKKEEKK